MQAEQARLAAEKQALEAIDLQRSALLRSVSHDLRTPLAAIRAVVSDLRDEVLYDAAARQELLELVADEAERLDRLVQNLLSMSRIEAGSLQPERQAVAIDELLDNRVQRLRPLLRDATVTVQADPGLPLVSADYTMVEQVVTNLLENATRHSPPGSPIVVSANARGDFIEVSVIDQGPGLDAADVERLFRPFERGPGSRSSGLGLAICRAFVEAHGGTIGVNGAGTDRRQPGRPVHVHAPGPSWLTATLSSSSTTNRRSSGFSSPPSERGDTASIAARTGSRGDRISEPANAVGSHLGSRTSRRGRSRGLSAHPDLV